MITADGTEAMNRRIAGASGDAPRAVLNHRIIAPAVLFLALLALGLTGLTESSAAETPWNPPATQLSDAGKSAVEPEIAVGADGTKAAVWARNNEYIYNRIQARIKPAGEGWGPVRTLSEYSYAAKDPDVAVGPDGSVTVVWTRCDFGALVGLYDCRARYKSALAPASGNPPPTDFGPTHNLSSAGNDDAFEPQIAVGKNGKMTAAWTFINGSKYSIQTGSKPSRGETFGDTATLSPVSGVRVREPQVAVGPDNRATVVWITPRSGSDKQDDIMARSQGAEPGSWGEIDQVSDLDWTDAIPQVSDATVASPQIAIDEEGSASVVWTSRIFLDGTGLDTFISQANRASGNSSFGYPGDFQDVAGMNGRHASKPVHLGSVTEVEFSGSFERAMQKSIKKLEDQLDAKMKEESTQR